VVYDEIKKYITSLGIDVSRYRDPYELQGDILQATLDYYKISIRDLYRIKSFRGLVTALPKLCAKLIYERYKEG
jgi:hypothetical protein